MSEDHRSVDLFSEKRRHLKAGDRVLCRNGHHVCDVVRDTKDAPANGWHVCFSNWQQRAPCHGAPLPIRCEKCDAVAIGYEAAA